MDLPASGRFFLELWEISLQASDHWRWSSEVNWSPHSPTDHHLVIKNEICWPFPARLGGIAIADPSADTGEFDYSLKITQPLVEAIIQQVPQYTEEMITKQLDEKKQYTN